MRKFLHYALNRLVITALIVLLQVAFFMVEIVVWGNYYVEIAMCLRLLSFGVIIALIIKQGNPAVKMAWIVPILLFPLFGGIMYLALGHVFRPKRLYMAMAHTNELVRSNLQQDIEIMDRLKETDPGIANQCDYIMRYAHTPAWEHTRADYYPEGFPWWQQLLKDLEQAERFVFLEFFILGEGTMWNTVLAVLERKVKAGVEVRLIYDDVGSVFLLPKEYNEMMERKGIKCVAFNRLVPFLALVLNNRDHRKIVVIDGKVGYTGGINMSDEYINYKKTHGDHWKDAGIRIEGDAVWNFTVMFLQMWNMSRHTEEYYGRYRYQFTNRPASTGIVQPYMDTPLDDETVGENVYLNMIGAARKYLYIFTPYLVTDNEMHTALKLAAKRGVDVRIVTPGTPDKKTIYWLTQSNYQSLIEAGVSIYQYAPQFIHSNCVLCYDETAVVGSINFDYRSFCHHFECGVFLYRASMIKDLKKDMEETFKVSEQITLEWCKKKFVKTNVIGPFLKLFSPLL